MAPTISQNLGSNSSTATGKKPSLVLYGSVAFIALFKDLLDLIGLGSIPFIGTVVTLCFSMLIFMLLFLFDRSGGRGNKKMAQGMVMVSGTLIEGLGFVLNFLPLETLTVVLLYIISYRAWKNAEKVGALGKQEQTKKMRLQQVRLARAMARQEQEVAEAAATPSQQSVPPAANESAVLAMGAEQANRAARITVRRGQVISSTPLVKPARTPLAGSVVATRPSIISGSQQSVAKDATYRIREAGSRMSQVASGASGRSLALTHSGSSVKPRGRFRQKA